MTQFTPVASTEDFFAVFPGINADAESIGSLSPYLNCDPEGNGHHIVDGRFTSRELQALGYWLTHLPSFIPRDEAGPLWADEEVKEVNSLASQIEALGITSAAKVNELFPDSIISRECFSCRTCDYLSCDSEGEGDHVVDGTFTNAQLLGLVYWVTHLDEFPSDE